MAIKKSIKRSERNNPTLHGLLVARTLSGTVVRVLLFLVLSAALVLVATMNVDDGKGGAIVVLGLIGAAYLLFDVLYVLMSNIRPLHPRLDRVILPGVLIFSLLSLYAPLILITTTAMNVIDIWFGAGLGLLAVLVARLAVLGVHMLR